MTNSSARFHFHPTLKSRVARGFTVPEMLAVVAIIVIVLSILLPSLSSSRESTKNATCSNNQHQIGIAFKAFAADRRRNPNASETLYDLGPYFGNQEGSMYVCPKASGSFSYGVNPCVQRLQGESGKIILVDAKEPVVHYDGTTSQEWLETVAPRHYDTKLLNVLFYDGSSRNAKPEEVNPYLSVENLNNLWKPKAFCDPRDPATGGGGCGCLATYYSGHFGGASSTRIDPTLHMPFGGAFFGYTTWNIPLPGSNPGGWDTGSFGSATWTGKIRAEFSEDYTFSLACDNEAWLYVNGQLVLNRSAGGVDGVTAYESSGPVSMTGGKWVAIEVRLKELTPGISPSHVSVKWQSQSTPLSTVNCSSLKPR